MRQQAVVISEIEDSIYSGSADMFVKGQGGLPDTLLARAQTIYAKLPASVPLPPIVGAAADRAAAIDRRWSPSAPGGSAAAAVARPADTDQNPNLCQNPQVRALPTLGDKGHPFPDPASAGLGSAIDGFPLAGGPVAVHVVNGRVIVCVDLTLPKLLPCDPGDATGFVLNATLAADQSGLEVQSLHADLGCAIIAGVVFESVAFDYDAQGRHWEAQGTVEAIPGVTLHGDITFEQGDFKSATVSLGNEGYAVPPWQVTDAELEVDPTHTGGTVGISLWPEIRRSCMFRG